MYPLQEHFGGVSVKKRVLVNGNGACSKSKTLVNIVLSKKIYGPISGFKEEEQRNKGNSTETQKTRSKTEKI